MATKKSGKAVEDGKICAALAYFLIGIIWYFVDEKMKKNAFAKFHTKQSIVLLIFSIGWSILLAIVMAIVGVIPILGMILAMFISLLGWVPMVLGIIGLINAFNGNEKELPIIGSYANKLKF